jgi:hypothetical protein
VSEAGKQSQEAERERVGRAIAGWATRPDRVGTVVWDVRSCGTSHGIWRRIGLDSGARREGSPLAFGPVSTCFLSRSCGGFLLGFRGHDGIGAALIFVSMQLASC